MIGDHLLQFLVRRGFRRDQSFLAAALELSPLNIRLGPFNGATRVRDRGVCGFNAGIGGFDLCLRGVDIFARLHNARVL